MIEHDKKVAFTVTNDGRLDIRIPMNRFDNRKGLGFVIDQGCLVLHLDRETLRLLPSQMELLAAQQSYDEAEKQSHIK